LPSNSFALPCGKVFEKDAFQPLLVAKGAHDFLKEIIQLLPKNRAMPTTRAHLHESLLL